MNDVLSCLRQIVTDLGDTDPVAPDELQALRRIVAVVNPAAEVAPDELTAWRQVASWLSVTGADALADALAAQRAVLSALSVAGTPQDELQAARLLAFVDGEGPGPLALESPLGVQQATVEADEIRDSHFVLSGGRLLRTTLLEPSAANRVDPDFSTWTPRLGGSGVVIKTLDAGVSPSGATDAARIEASVTPGSSVTHEATLTASVSLAGPNMLSIWARSLGGPVTIRLNEAGLATTIDVTEEWQRFSVAGYNYTGVTTMRVGVRGGGIGDDSCDVLVWSPQAEDGAVATSFVDGTRLADILTLTLPAGDVVLNWLDPWTGTEQTETVSHAGGAFVVPVGTGRAYRSIEQGGALVYRPGFAYTGFVRDSVASFAEGA